MRRELRLPVLFAALYAVCALALWLRGQGLFHWLANP